MVVTLSPVNLVDYDHSASMPRLGSLTRSIDGEARDVRDFDTPVNPYFPTTDLFRALGDRLEESLRRSPSANGAIAEVLGRTLGYDPDTLVLGNGASELISWINQLFVRDSFALATPSFNRWSDVVAASGKELHTYQCPESRDFALSPAEYVEFVRRSGARVALLSNPGNPTGALLQPAEVLEVMAELRDLDLVVIDEAFIDFAEESAVPSVAARVAAFPNALVLRSLGKTFGLHGLRLGYAVAHPDLVRPLAGALPAWNINSLGELLIRELSNHLPAYEQARRQVVRDRLYLEARLREIPQIRVYPSKANFVYFRLADQYPGLRLRNALLTRYGCQVRECGSLPGGGSQYFRIAARPQAETALLVGAIKRLLA